MWSGSFLSVTWLKKELNVHPPPPDVFYSVLRLSELSAHQNIISTALVSPSCEWLSVVQPRVSVTICVTTLEVRAHQCEQIEMFPLLIRLQVLSLLSVL